MTSKTVAGARIGWRVRAVSCAAAAATAAFALLGTVGNASFNPGLPLTANPVRSVEPVVLTGNQFPTWSAGPEFTFHEPMSPLNSITVGQQSREPQQLQSDCYDPKANYGSGPTPDPANGDHNCYQSSRLPLRTLPITKGVDPRKILGYRWDGKHFVQIPFQVDQVFTRYLTNNASGFAIYSGTDQHTDYAYDREGFRFLANRPPADPNNPTTDVCTALPYKAPGGGFYDGQPTTPSPNGFHLVDKDELVFMARDAGRPAPSGAVMPGGILDSYAVTVTDPSTGNQGVVYVALASDKGPAPKYTAQNSPYVHYQRDSDAGMFVYSQSSYGSYGAAPQGYYCNPDGTLALKNGKPAIGQRRPKDTAWVWTPNYAFRYDGRWLMTEIHVASKGNGYIDKYGQLHNYGPNIVDRWKARAFQQSPGGDTPCCGYEEEATNWGGSSQLLGEKAGPVRVVRATWGADSSTNNIRREVFYTSQVRYQDDLRVHVIPPFDGIYVQRDMAAGIIDTYYNPYQSQGVPVQGINEEVFGNTHQGLGSNGYCYSSNDQLGAMIQKLTGKKSVTVGPPGGPDPCENNDIFHGDFDFADPTFSGPPGELAWEELTGKYGTVVERWTGQVTSPGGVVIGAATSFPYYRDDSCFDDGTGVNPGPKINLRSKDEPKYWWYDPVTHVPTTSLTPPAGVTLYPRRCWNHHVDGTPYNIKGTQSFDATKKAEKPDPIPNPSFSPQGDIRYFQGDIGTHGLHVMLIADSDNAQMTVPVDELDSEQVQVILPGRQRNVGEAYGRSFEKPLVATAAPAQGLQVQNLATP